MELDQFVFSLILLIIIYFNQNIQAKSSDSSTFFLKWNMESNKDQCPEKNSYLWIKHEFGQNCIRYFSSQNIKNADVVIVQLYGDRDLDARMAINQIENNTQEQQERYAQKMEKKGSIPFIVIARPGTYGSSGNHSERRMKSEFIAINSAIDSIKLKYGIKNIVLMGHSGGATVVASLLTFGRKDVRCAILSSGTYDYFAREALQRLDRKVTVKGDGIILKISQKYDPMFHIDGIVHDQERQIYIIGDKRDKNTPFHLQMAFAWAVWSKGHNVKINSVSDGIAPTFHNLKNGITFDKAIQCINSKNRNTGEVEDTS